MLSEIEKATKLKRRHITSLILVVVGMIVYYFFGSVFFSLANVVLTCLIPLYLSFESLPSSSTEREDNKAVTLWLGYWIVYITTEVVMCVLNFLSENAEAWWILQWIFMIVRFVTLSCLVIGDDIVRDAMCREVLYPLRNSVRRLNVGGGSSSHHHHHHHKNSSSGAVSQATLEEGGSISSHIMNQQSSVSADIYQRKSAVPTNQTTTRMT